MSLKRRLFIAFAFIFIMMGLSGFYMSFTLRYMSHMKSVNDQIITIRNEVNQMEISKLNFISVDSGRDDSDVHYHIDIILEAVERVKDEDVSATQAQNFDSLTENVSRYREKFMSLVDLEEERLGYRATIKNDLEDLMTAMKGSDAEFLGGNSRSLETVYSAIFQMYSDSEGRLYTSNAEGAGLWRSVETADLTVGEAFKDSDGPKVRLENVELEGLLLRIEDNTRIVNVLEDSLSAVSMELDLIFEDISETVALSLDMHTELMKTERLGIIRSFNMTLPIIAVIYIITNYYVTKYIGKNLNILTEATGRIASGEYETRVRTPKNDEFATLAGAINEMGASLLESTKDLIATKKALETQVEKRTEELNEANVELKKANEALSIEKERLAALAKTDVLTGLMNRRAILEFVEEQIAEALRYKRPFTVMLVDLDRFKRVNDQYGHAAGDEVLQKVAAALSHTVRSTDHVGRFGGEEFLMVLPETTKSHAASIIERVQDRIRQLTFSHEELKVTFSGGVAQYTAGTAEDLLREADENLYAAKASGRDRVVYSELR